eukprot:TRINITY_DN1276_c0_g3_i1.p1 TRINITY_DN1276_c0_g3~~TRINITY_DN1276_c0_g3_i1.p1  ORF type:complete len:222 (-),score=32.50 TRINITY_DN1276_c0_g3_i1:130-795(-)
MTELTSADDKSPPSAASDNLPKEVQDSTPGLAQVWYSPKTLEVLRQEVLSSGCRTAAFLSVPSVFFGLTEEERLRCGCQLFEYDRRWESEQGFVFFDYKSPLESIDSSLHGRFDFIIADPPALMQDVLAKYAEVIKLLASPDAKIIFSTLESFMPRMLDMLDAFPQRFKPMLPGFAWADTGRYAFFTNYRSEALRKPNEELEAHLRENEDSDAPVEEYWAY